LGFNTKCDQCGRQGTPLTLGDPCGACGVCQGTMVENR
jgi:hypothetical protein